MAARGTYKAERAAALSGVPKSTVHHWHREGIIVPSVSAERIKLWSFGDLLALRTIYWLRHPKDERGGQAVPVTPMPKIRQALAQVREVAEQFSADDRQGIAVDRAGRLVVLKHGQVVEVPDGQGVLGADLLDLTGPFAAEENIVGPDLKRPRPHLRIVPGKLGGSPHVEDTRLETEALGALERRGFDSARIYRLYPAVERGYVDEALDLERQLAGNLGAVAA